MAALSPRASDPSTAGLGYDHAVQTTGFDSASVAQPPSAARLDGGRGAAHLVVGSSESRLEIELGDSGTHHPDCVQRLGLGISVAGRRVLSGPSPAASSPRGFERASASGNVVLVNGLNQRESLEELHRPAPPTDVRFFAAQPDLQVACLEDRVAYPAFTSLYRHTIVAIDGPQGAYAVSLFQVEGGLQHDQLYHAAPGSSAQWQTPVALPAYGQSLLPPSIPFIPSARAENGRWFVQALGEIGSLRAAALDGPTQAVLFDGKHPGVRLHLLTEQPSTLFVGRVQKGPDSPGRSSLVLRRTSTGGAPHSTRFITLIEPILPGTTQALRRVGRIESGDDCIAIALDTSQGTEYLVINARPNSPQAIPLGEREIMRTDALVVHATDDGLVQAGGTYCEFRHLRSTAPGQWGTLVAAARQHLGSSLGWFEASQPIESPELAAGQTLIVRHGDNSSHAWTIDKVTASPDGRTRIEVKEEPGFTIDLATGDAIYYQHPRTRAPGPHVFRVCHISRSLTGSLDTSTTQLAR
jgi:hypothetical protein